MDRFDIVVIGGGPAGCLAAGRLARRGASVALVDGSHPREKPCGGGVTMRALELVGDSVDLARVPRVAIESARFEHRGRVARVALRPSATLPALAIVPRREFDRALLESAVAAGARLIAARAHDIRADGNGWVVSMRDRNIRAGWLLGADGPGSLVRRRVCRPFDRADLSIAAGYYVRGGMSSSIDLAFTDDPPGYLWAFPRHDHLAVGVCAQADRTSSPALLAAARRWIAAHLQDAAVETTRYSWPIPSLDEAALGRERQAGRGWMLLGDAAGLVDPITREGIFFALQSAQAAAGSFDGPDPAGRYTTHLRDTVIEELRRSARVKARFFRPEFMSLFVTALQRSGRIRDVAADLISGRQTFRHLRGRLLATLEFKLMVELFVISRDTRLSPSRAPRCASP